MAYRRNATRASVCDRAAQLCTDAVGNVNRWEAHDNEVS